MTRFTLTKTITLTAVMEIDAKDGLAASIACGEWEPKYWASSQSLASAPVAEDPPAREGYWVRECRGHFHVTCSLDDLILPGDPFKTEADAQAALDRMLVEDAARAVQPSLAAPQESEGPTHG